MDFVSKRRYIQVPQVSCESKGPPPLPTHPSPNMAVHSSVTNFPMIGIIVVAMLSTSLLLLGYYVLVIKCCLNWNRVDHVRARRLSLSRLYEEPSVAYSTASEPRGLEEAVIQSIPVIHYKTEGDLGFGERSFSECAVCLNEFQEDEKVRVIPNCSHAFHIDCVDVWLQNNANCPLCRRRVSLTSQTQVDQLLTPRPSPQGQSQNVGNLVGGDEDIVVIDLDSEHDGGQNLQGRQERGKELEVPTGPVSPNSQRKLEQNIAEKKARKLHKVTSMGDECIGIGDKDDGFSGQLIRRSFSMDLSVHRQALHQQNGHVHEVSSIEVCGDSSGRAAKRSFFSFGHGSRSRSAVLPV